MPQSYSLNKLAEAAGLTPEQLLKAAGILALAEKGVLKFSEDQFPKTGDCEKRLMHVLSLERAVSFEELAKIVPPEALDETAKKLVEQGKALMAVNPYGVKVVAIADDGTLNLTTLPPEEKDWMVVNAYGNRDKGLSYAKLYNFLKAPAATKQSHRGKRRRMSRTQQVFEALKQGPMSLSKIASTLKVSIGTVSWAIAELQKAGKVKRLKRGLYASTEAQL
jgi:biotin operon repressor